VLILAAFIPINLHGSGFVVASCPPVAGGAANVVMMDNGHGCPADASAAATIPGLSVVAELSAATVVGSFVESTSGFVILGPPTSSGAALGLISGVTPIIQVLDGLGGLTAALDPGGPQSTVAGSGSGSAIFNQPFQGVFYKKVQIFASGLTGTASYIFPLAFTQTPACIATSLLACSVLTSITNSAVTITGAGTTGTIFLEGF
jgi:hypothetical protein